MKLLFLKTEQILNLSLEANIYGLIGIKKRARSIYGSCYFKIYDEIDAKSNALNIGIYGKLELVIRDILKVLPWFLVVALQLLWALIFNPKVNERKPHNETVNNSSCHSWFFNYRFCTTGT
jgi:hypothetical protein